MNKFRQEIKYKLLGKNINTEKEISNILEKIPSGIDDLSLYEYLKYMQKYINLNFIITSEGVSFSEIAIG